MANISVVDSHQHFWRADTELHPWLPPGNAALFRDFLPGTLAPLLRAHDVAATVAVQASPNDADTDSLIALAASHSWLRGVVGWVDAHSPTCEPRLRALAATPKFRGLRPTIRRPAGQQWRPDRREMGLLELAASLGLSVDLLVNAHQLDRVAELAADLPRAAMILDHAGAPPAAGDAFGLWAGAIGRLGRYPNIYCKFSGLATLGPHADAAFVERVALVLVGAFGVERLIWGSDWPILVQATDYGAWLNLAAETIERIAGAAALAAVMRDNADTFYRLGLR